MDLNSIDNRLLVLQCLKENSQNMLMEQIHLRDRISTVLSRARDTLDSIRALNVEVREMKVSVENALAVNERFGQMIDEGLVERMLVEEQQPEELNIMIEELQSIGENIRLKTEEENGEGEKGADDDHEYQQLE